MRIENGVIEAYRVSLHKIKSQIGALSSECIPTEAKQHIPALLTIEAEAEAAFRNFQNGINNDQRRINERSMGIQKAYQKNATRPIYGSFV